jgi:hypothetical protein
MSIVLQGSTSGSVTLQEPAVAGTTVLDLPAVSGTILTTTSPKAGSVLQVVNATYAVETSNITNTYVDTGLSATITPTSATNKILILVNQADCVKFTGNTAVNLRLVRNSTVLYTFAARGSFTNTTADLLVTSIGTNYLDSPATTSAVTYKTQFISLTNVSGTRVQYEGGTSTITLLEIAA